MSEQAAEKDHLDDIDVALAIFLMGHASMLVMALAVWWAIR